MCAVRKMSTKDIPTCASIFVHVYQTVYSEPWTMETGEQRIAEIYTKSRDLCFVLEIENVIRGFLAARSFSWYDGIRVWIEEIVIDEGYRGQGYGTLLLNALQNRGNHKGVVGYSLISEKDSKAYLYYLKKGFTLSAWVHMAI
jgi:aminoglycoside 6'-N-acetyltransferase I